MHDAKIALTPSTSSVWCLDAVSQGAEVVWLRPRPQWAIKRVDKNQHGDFRTGEMKSFRKELWFHIPSRRALINITQQVEECLRQSEIKEGLVLVNAMHITASVFINDDETGLHHDFDVWLEKLAPHEPVSPYRHNNGEDNADAHLNRSIMGRE